MADLKGQVALVTGASRGIGSDIAQYLGEAGVNVGVNYLASEDAASRVVDSVTKAGAEAVLLPAESGGPVAKRRAGRNTSFATATRATLERLWTAV